MLFISGKWVWTHAVNDKVADDPEFARFVFTSIKRHCAGDWGDLGREDKAENRLALEHGLRLFSAYGENEEKIYIITEADRSSTTILFPSEY